MGKRMRCINIFSVFKITVLFILVIGLTGCESKMTYKDAEKKLQQYLIERDGLPLDYFDCPEKYINMKVKK